MSTGKDEPSLVEKTEEAVKQIKSGQKPVPKELIELFEEMGMGK